MWIVQLALRRPYTFVVAALLIVGLGVLSVLQMPKDVLPAIDIPIVTVIWSYGGMPPDEMEKRIVTYAQRAYTTTVNDIEHMESQTMPGVGVVRIYFQPGAKVDLALSQVTASSQTILRIMPTGTTAPLILRYNAANVPVLQAGLRSDTMTEQDLYDQANNFLRIQLVTVQGAQIPTPYGGKSRQVMVDLDLPAIQAHGLTPTDVLNAVNQQNLTIPAGTARIGTEEYVVRLNSTPTAIDELNDMPVATGKDGQVVLLRDVANVRDGFATQNNIVRVDGRRSALLTILKAGSASTLDVVERVKAALPRIKSTLPPELGVNLLFDQSKFVSAAIQGVLTEALIAACLTALMILLFLGSLRSTLIVAISIPLSVMTSILLLHALGQTINIMTLGGLALAVGILVDDATVEIENIHRNLGEGKPIRRAILDGAQQIAVPTFVATTAICIVFAPVFFIVGAARELFVPLAYAVVFAVGSSYLFSRTVVPTLSLYLLRHEVGLYQGFGEDELPDLGVMQRGVWHIHERFNHSFERMRDRYRGGLSWALANKRPVFAAFGFFVAGSIFLFPFLGANFFPSVDAGQIRLHVRGRAGTRIEETEKLFGRVETTIRNVIPAPETELILDNIGLPNGINLAFGDSASIGPSDGEILISLKEGKHGSTPAYVEKLRKRLNHDYPDATFFFQPADIVGQILNFGLPAPMDVQIIGPSRNVQQNYALAKQMEAEMRRVPGAVDVHLHQVVDSPELFVNVDRSRAQQSGLTQRDVANNVLISLSGSGQVSPGFWLSPQGVSYGIVAQVPLDKINSIDDLKNFPLGGANGGQLLSNVATFSHRTTPAVTNLYNVQPVYDIYASVQGRDMNGVAQDFQKILAKARKNMPRGTQIVMRGQVESMNASFFGLSFGLIFAIVLVYALMVVNFQSWLDPFIIITCLPGALCGILWMLFVTQTPISVPALMGAIMSIGVATANSILLVTFANDKRRDGLDATAAALEAGTTRLRPVMMTALAMVIGMLPMSLGLGEGGEQNAPLGRAVIGGLTVATVATLFLVPVVYSLFRRQAYIDPAEVAEQEEAAEEEAYAQHQAKMAEHSDEKPANETANDAAAKGNG